MVKTIFSDSTVWFSAFFFHVIPTFLGHPRVTAPSPQAPRLPRRRIRSKPWRRRSSRRPLKQPAPWQWRRWRWQWWGVLIKTPPVEIRWISSAIVCRIFLGGAVLRMCKVMVGINSCSFFKPNMTWVLMKIRELLWTYSIRVEVCGQKEDCNII